MKYFIIQSKGGAGKSYVAKVLSLLADKESIETYFIDTDDRSATLTSFFKAINGRKSSHIKFKSMNLLGKDKKIDRTKVDVLLGEVEQLPNVVVDFGAESSQHFLHYLESEQNQGIVDLLKELDIHILLIMSGGAVRESVQFALALKEIKGLDKITKLVANEYGGNINGKSVKEYTDADIQILPMHDEPDSEAQIEWNTMMRDGVVYADIEAMTLIRKRRIINHLNSIFNQLR